MPTNTDRAGEIVRALISCTAGPCPTDCPRYNMPCAGCKEELHEEAASLIESMQAQLATSQRKAQDARNELCLKCGRYRQAHNGACDGCRWKEI